MQHHRGAGTAGEFRRCDGGEAGAAHDREEGGRCERALIGIDLDGVGAERSVRRHIELHNDLARAVHGPVFKADDEVGDPDIADQGHAAHLQHRRE